MFARGEAVEAGVSGGQGKAGLRFAFEVEHFGFSQYFGFQIKYINQAGVVALAHFIVVEIVRGRDFHAAGAEIFFHIFIGNHGNAAAGERQQQFLAD